MNRKRGFTLIELLVVIAIIALLIGLLLPALAKAQRNARSLKDKAQIKQIHQAMLVFANDNDEVLPTPGLIDREPDEYTGQELPGVGKEDVSANTTQALYSCMIAREYFNPDLLIGPTEQNPVIKEYRNYNYQAYDPTSAVDTYWDPDFKATLNGTVAGDCNTSYQHMLLYGQRKKVRWRSSSRENDPIISSRGPFHDTASTPTDPKQISRSYTLLLHGPKKEWWGNIAYSDNHTEVAQTFYPPLVSYEPQYAEGQLTKDNIFAAESEFVELEELDDVYGSGDAFQVMCTVLEPFIDIQSEQLVP